SEIKFKKNDNPDNKALSDKDALDKGISLTKILYELEIDTNGSTKPNKPSRDKFKYVVGDDGRLYPYWGHDYQILTNGSYTAVAKANCPADGDAGYKCTAYIVEHGYKMDY
ncbi:MAG: hypothetical protein MJ231_01050, partial [bacterium]|nr:hypothetical protein [bacterium]